MKQSHDLEIFLLVGGFGTRLKSVVSDRPKPMAQVHDKPFLEYLVLWLVKQGFKNITFLTYFDSSKISDYFQDGSTFQAQINYVKEDFPLGTGGAIINGVNQRKCKSSFLLINGDSFIDLDLNQFIEQCSGSDFSLALSYQNDCSRYGTVSFDDQNNLLSFNEKDLNKKNSYINAGVYYFSSGKHFEDFPAEQKLSLENDIIPKFLEKNMNLQVFKSSDYFIDIGLPESYQQFIDYISQCQS